MTAVANQEITSALKTALKSRGYTYRQVAVKIGVSEKTVKRLFSEKDCSLTRLTQVCDAINLSVYDLLDFAKHYSKPSVRLTDEQQKFLGAHPQHMAFLFFLTVGYTATQIQEKYVLSELSLFRYLRDLDKQGFLDLAENNRYHMKVDGRMLIPLHGPMHNFVRQANRDFLDYTIDKDGQPGIDFNSSFRHMSMDTLNAFKGDLKELAAKYQKLSQRDEAVLPRNKLVPVKWVFASAIFEIFGKWTIEELED